MAVAVSSSGGGWSKLFYLLLAGAGIGFAGYVYLIPYQKMEHAVGGNQSAVADERRAAESAIAERDRLKADVERYKVAVAEKSTSDGKRKASIDTLATTLKPGLEALGATIVADPAAVMVSFPSTKIIDSNGIDVSESNGMAAMKILAEAAKRESAKVRIRARSSAAAPPKELRGLFHTAGEMNAVRAARVMSALEHAGVAPARITIFGDVAEKGASARPARGKKAVVATGDRVELEIEPE
ncbi:MAG TPA: hypothetical protein VKQ32_00995 [Polyangia bacterium]|nr:hypothetical protein [Polyangia bacterium]